MANVIGFQTQIASIMEVLANAAVAEICKLVEDGYTVLRLEISHSQRENVVLKRKLQMMEIQRSFHRRALKNSLTRPAKASCEKFPENTTVVEGDVNHLRRDGETSVGQDTAMPSAVLSESVYSEEERPPVVIIKEETDDVRSSDPGAQLSIGGQTSGSGNAYADAHSSPTADPDEFNDCHRTRQDGPESADAGGVGPEFLKDEDLDKFIVDSEDSQTLQGAVESENQDGEKGSGLETRANPDKACVLYTAWDEQRFEAVNQSLPYSGPECSAGTSSNRNPPYFLSRAAERPACSYATPADPQKGPVADVNTNFSHRNDKPAAATRPAAPHSPLRFACKHCGKAWPHASALLLHQRVHTGERPFSCSLCGKKFTQSSSLRKHQSVHTGEKPFACSYCLKQFSDSSNLRKHVSVHTGEKPFHCGQCGKTFNQSSNLKTHMKIHTGEKPFGCEHCGQIFAYKSSLMKHQLKNCLGQQNLIGRMYLSAKEGEGEAGMEFAP